MSDEWIEQARMFRAEDMKYTDIARKLQYLFPDKNYKQVYAIVRRLETRYAEHPKKKQGIYLKPNVYPTTTNVEWNNQSQITIAMLSDTHIGSYDTQITLLHEFYKECHKRHIKTIFHCGDICEGERMRDGHPYECYRHGADQHVDHICAVYPKIKGMTTYFITGNHDASLIKRLGFNIGPAIALRRNDMIYLGRDCAIINITPQCSVELRHPADGSNMALSAKPQRLVDKMSYEEKPNLLFVGHYHKMLYMEYKNVHTYLTGCFQAQTSFMKNRGLAAAVGGWIITLKLDKDTGAIKRIKNEFVPYKKSIKNDYLDWV